MSLTRISSPPDTIYADATKYNVAHTLGLGPNDEDTFVSETECIKRDDGTFVCEAKGQMIRVDVNPNSTSTSTYIKFTTYTAPAQPWYTIKGESSATSLSLPSSGPAMIMGVLTSLVFAAGLLL